MINDTYYHGSRKSGITRLMVNKAHGNPFGPAVYLTKDPMVADCYFRDGGAIYEVKLSGNVQFTVNLDIALGGQTTETKEAIFRVLKSLDLPFDKITSKTARDLIHPYGCNKTEVNDALMLNGIWMLYGHLSGIEVSGLMDRGVQFAVIDEPALRIIKETDYYNIVENK